MKAEILAHLGPHPWANRLQYVDTVDSTNTYLKTLSLQNAPHGTVLIADRQTGGRGRLGRSFHSPEGLGIYMSLLLRPQCPPEQLMHLTCATAVAACDAVEAVTGLRPGIKWTNDLVVGHQKIAGILTELVHTSQGICAIIGIGINCQQKEEDFPPEIRDMAASLSMLTGRSPSRSALCAALISALFKMDANLFSGKEEMLNRYRRDCVTLGKEISIVRGDGTSHATALDIDSDGALVVRYAYGKMEKVASGEVSIRGMYGYV